VAHFESTLRDGRYRHRAAERYGLTLALIRNKELARARGEIDALAAASPNQLEYQVASARLYTESGNPRAALRVLRQALERHPDSYPLSVAAAETMLDVGDDAGAYALLRKWLRKRPGDPDLRRLQARAAAATGRVGESHAHLAEYHYGIGEIEAAQRQLEIAARDRSLDFYARSQVEARLQVVKSEAEALKRESRRRK
jgi:predicted Zn-dependent protease